MGPTTPEIFEFGVWQNLSDLDSRNYGSVQSSFVGSQCPRAVAQTGFCSATSYIWAGSLETSRMGAPVPPPFLHRPKKYTLWRELDLTVLMSTQNMILH